MNSSVIHQLEEDCIHKISLLSSAETSSIIQEFGLELSQYNEEMRTALGTPKLNFRELSTFTYSLQNNVFSWKKSMADGIFAKLGSVNVQKVAVAQTYEEILDELIEKLSTCEESIEELRNENISVKKDRDKAMAKVKELANMKEQWEKTLYGRFISLLNTKKEKILSLEEELEFQNSKDGEGCFDTKEPKSEGEDEREDTSTDPYLAPTDVDSDLDENMEEDRPSSPPPLSSATLRRNLSMLESFDSSPGSPSPAPIMPKRRHLSMLEGFDSSPGCQSPPLIMPKQRHLSTLESFDSSPGSPSPAPIMPKRSRIQVASIEVAEAVPSEEGQEHTLSAIDQTVVPQEGRNGEDSDDDMPSLTLGEDTQDLLNEF